MGIVVGAVIVSSVPELLRSSANARPLFYGAILIALLVKLRPWRLLAAELGGLVAFGFAVHAIAEAAYPRLVDGKALGSGSFAHACAMYENSANFKSSSSPVRSLMKARLSSP